jgi:anti-sigma B factor antagonist
MTTPEPALPQPTVPPTGQPDGAWTTIELPTELDLYSAPGLREQVLKAVTSGRLHVVLDLSGTTFVDSSGFAVMVSAYKRVRALGGQMRVSCSAPAVLSAMRISGLDRVFQVFPDMAAATAQAPADPDAAASDDGAPGGADG